jgi:mono/diheme cytochrome c family protein
MKGLNLAITITALTALVSCSESHFKEDKIFAGGVYAPATALNAGKTTYTEYCMPCHGVNGDGKGTSAKGLQVPPRNFTQGLYKFGQVVSGELPHDEHFYKILKEGLTGTAMLPWKELSDIQMFNLVQYIKTFAPDKWVGAEKKLGDVITLTKDPFGDAHKESAIQKGKEVYHAVAQCWTCHRAYVSKNEFSEISQKINDKPVTEFDPDMFHVKLQPNEYGASSMPPEFTYDSVRSANTVEELYIRISAGIGGTSMPSWKGTLQDDEIWAVAHYVKSLMDMKNTPKRTQLLEAAK